MFKRTHIYTVHVKTTASGVLEDVQFVREGFNFWAFFFTVFWAVYHRAWSFGILCSSWFVVLQMMGEQQILHPTSLGILQVGISAILGYLANDALRDALKKRGYKQEYITTGESRIRAEQRFFDRYNASSVAI
jgi:hypothetical protein